MAWLSEIKGCIGQDLTVGLGDQLSESMAEAINPSRERGSDSKLRKLTESHAQEGCGSLQHCPPRVSRT